MINKPEDVVVEELRGGSDWGYSWIPVVGPLVGASIVALLYVALGKF